MLGRLSSIKIESSGSPVLHVGQASYRAVVVGHLSTIRSSTVRLLSEFAAAGGRVIFVGDPPCYVVRCASTGIA